MIKVIDQRRLNITLTEMSGQYNLKKDKALEEIFLDNVSHEIRTPLNAIIGFNDLLNGVAGQHMEEDEKLMMKDHIHKSADRLITVVNDILDLSKMEKGLLTLHKTVASLMEICYKARESVKYEVQEGVRLQHEYPVALKDTKIYTDAKRLEQVLHNFLLNACHHTYSGTITLKVKAYEDAESKQPMLQIRVDDTGIGIPVDQRELLFLPFRKMDGKSEGLGMGLAICRQIAKMLGGKTYYDQYNADGGSSFVLEMPFEKV
jgi:hypothetical protein